MIMRNWSSHSQCLRNKTSLAGSLLSSTWCSQNCTCPACQPGTTKKLWRKGSPQDSQRAPPVAPSNTWPSRRRLLSSAAASLARAHPQRTTGRRSLSPAVMAGGELLKGVSLPFILHNFPSGFPSFFVASNDFGAPFQRRQFVGLLLQNGRHTRFFC